MSINAREKRRSNMALNSDIAFKIGCGRYIQERKAIKNNLITPTLISSRTFKSGEIFRLSDFSAKDNELLLLDNITGSIQSFKYENQELIFTKNLVSSFGADLDKLYNPKDFALYRAMNT